MSFFGKAIKHLDRHQLIRTHQIHQFTWTFPTVPTNQHPVNFSSQVQIHPETKGLEKALAQKCSPPLVNKRKRKSEFVCEKLGKDGLPALSA
jgi:hypothetical protein